VQSGASLERGEEHPLQLGDGYGPEGRQMLGGDSHGEHARAAQRFDLDGGAQVVIGNSHFSRAVKTLACLGVRRVCAFVFHSHWFVVS
jgi:hypothetical protein